MLIERRDNAVVVRAPAKVNLFLEVLARRPDGYHDVATLMAAVSLYDTLEFKEDPSGAVRLRCDNPDLSAGPDNLVHRAAEVLRRRTGCALGAAVLLRKRIPMAAGLAGGSTDAAAALAGLNLLWRLGLPAAELARLGAEVGSDVPFFFATPAAWCTGRGEAVAPLRLGRPLDFVLACPPVGLSTAEVYRNVTVPARPESGDAIRRAAEAGNVEEVAVRLHNRLQEPAVRLRPEIAAALGRLREAGPAGQMMSGSGTSAFALCRDPGEALGLARRLRREESDPSGRAAGLKLFVVRSCS
jgi:4-diphosphocytidyl-2-C-methyl-D-erythritol kinase